MLIRKNAGQYVPGSFGCHEVLHMASFLTDAVGEQLCDHPAILTNPQWAAMAEKVHNDLAALYQAIGAEHMNDEL